MDEAEFDKFADEYHAMHSASIAASGEAPQYFAEYKIKDLAHEYSRHAGTAAKPPRILDFGSGSGGSVPYLSRYFPGSELTCADVSKRSLELAAARFPGSARFIQFDGRALPFEPGGFDIVFAACVFHHIDHAEHARLLEDWYRVLRPGGIAVVYEHNPYNPLTQRVVKSCAFDENAHLIPARAMRQTFARAGFARARVRFRVFFPFALRRLRPLESRMTWLPLGAQYYVVAAK